MLIVLYFFLPYDLFLVLKVLYLDFLLTCVVHFQLISVSRCIAARTDRGIENLIEVSKIVPQVRFKYKYCHKICFTEAMVKPKSMQNNAVLVVRNTNSNGIKQ